MRIKDLTNAQRFLVSASIWMFLWLPMVLISMPAVALLLLTQWDGKTTWFGNYLYGRAGNWHMPHDPNLFDRWYFLVIRNPVSNFGKFVLSTGPDNPWAWLIDSRIVGRMHVLYGWKNPDNRLPGSRRVFVFRPWLHS